jgi:predicted nucleotidyltransferase
MLVGASTAKGALRGHYDQMKMILHQDIVSRRRPDPNGLGTCGSFGRSPSPRAAALRSPMRDGTATCVSLRYSARSCAGETEMDSEIDLAAEFDPVARMDLLQLSAAERRIAELLGSPVELLPEPVEKRRLQDQINRDRRRAF